MFRVFRGGAALPTEALYQSVAVGQERTLEQDPTFAFRILVDIASKALSPAINDPTTAVLAIDQIHHLLRNVESRQSASRTGARRGRPAPRPLPDSELGRFRARWPSPRSASSAARASRSRAVCEPCWKTFCRRAREPCRAAPPRAELAPAVERTRLPRTGGSRAGGRQRSPGSGREGSPLDGKPPCRSIPLLRTPMCGNGVEGGPGGDPHHRKCRKWDDWDCRVMLHHLTDK